MAEAPPPQREPTGRPDDAQGQTPTDRSEGEGPRPHDDATNGQPASSIKQEQSPEQLERGTPTSADHGGPHERQSTPGDRFKKGWEIRGIRKCGRGHQVAVRIATPERHWGEIWPSHMVGQEAMDAYLGSSDVRYVGCDKNGLRVKHHRASNKAPMIAYVYMAQPTEGNIWAMRQIPATWIDVILPGHHTSTLVYWGDFKAMVGGTPGRAAMLIEDWYGRHKKQLPFPLRQFVTTSSRARFSRAVSQERQTYSPSPGPIPYYEEPGAGFDNGQGKGWRRVPQGYSPPPGVQYGRSWREPSSLERRRGVRASHDPSPSPTQEYEAQNRFARLEEGQRKLESLLSALTTKLQI